MRKSSPSPGMPGAKKAAAKSPALMSPRQPKRPAVPAKAAPPPSSTAADLGAQFEQMGPPRKFPTSRKYGGITSRYAQSAKAKAAAGSAPVTGSRPAASGYVASSRANSVRRNAGARSAGTRAGAESATDRAPLEKEASSFEATTISVGDTSLQDQSLLPPPPESGADAGRFSGLEEIVAESTWKATEALRSGRASEETVAESTWNATDLITSGHQSEVLAPESTWKATPGCEEIDGSTRIAAEALISDLGGTHQSGDHHGITHPPDFSPDPLPMGPSGEISGFDASSAGRADEVSGDTLGALGAGETVEGAFAAIGPATSLTQPSSECAQLPTTATMSPEFSDATNRGTRPVGVSVEDLFAENQSLREAMELQRKQIEAMSGGDPNSCEVSALTPRGPPAPVVRSNSATDDKPEASLAPCALTMPSFASTLGAEVAPPTESTLMSKMQSAGSRCAAEEVHPPEDQEESSHCGRFSAVTPSDSLKAEKESAGIGPMFMRSVLTLRTSATRPSSARFTAESVAERTARLTAATAPETAGEKPEPEPQAHMWQRTTPAEGDAMGSAARIAAPTPVAVVDLNTATGSLLKPRQRTDSCGSVRTSVSPPRVVPPITGLSRNGAFTPRAMESAVASPYLRTGTHSVPTPGGGVSTGTLSVPHPGGPFGPRPLVQPPISSPRGGVGASSGYPSAMFVLSPRSKAESPIPRPLQQPPLHQPVQQPPLHQPLHQPFQQPMQQPLQQQVTALLRQSNRSVSPHWTPSTHSLSGCIVPAGSLAGGGGQMRSGTMLHGPQSASPWSPQRRPSSRVISPVRTVSPTQAPVSTLSRGLLTPSAPMPGALTPRLTQAPMSGALTPRLASPTIAMPARR
mmetsp:Transcript_71797/g.199240  ORF Transcript_71797/g.199240 Transcript_71797/m.199240 type:complete len:864 (+) Transcript_71797:103-2694(+)